MCHKYKNISLYFIQNKIKNLKNKQILFSKYNFIKKNTCSQCLNKSD